MTGVDPAPVNFNTNPPRWFNKSTMFAHARILLLLSTLLLLILVTLPPPHSLLLQSILLVTVLYSYAMAFMMMLSYCESIRTELPGSLA
jgi:hypothetical protein